MTDARSPGLTARAIMQRWAKCHDTWMIAKYLGVTEAEVYRILAAEQDRKERIRATAAQHRERLVSLVAGCC